MLIEDFLNPESQGCLAMKNKMESYDPLVLMWQRFMISDELFDSARG